ncbi:MAG: Nif3-like dinuclear metal center hexameric protein [Pseudarcicella sp.]|nr:Nif3-like dinuclear metal center hexameric protein [Pseudarcicella sp.]
MKVFEITDYLEKLAPLAYQEDYDNSGLIIGHPDDEVLGILVSLDCTEKVIEEAIAKNCNLIISHHPIVFKGLKKINGNNYIERTVLKAIKNNIALYACHTNLDHVKNGVNFKIAEVLNLQHVKVLVPKKGLLKKITFFVPTQNAEKVSQALHNAGAGNIGEYQECSFEIEGDGFFTPSKNANPTIGNILEKTKVTEKRIEMIFPSFLESNITKALHQNHPYQEVAYYVNELTNKHQEIGAGVIGELENETNTSDFLAFLKEKMSLKCIRHTDILKEKIKKIAVCGGSGSFLLKDAIAQDADIFITADYKYHDFFDAENKITICDIGHYESEVFTKDLIVKYLSEKFSNFAILGSSTNTNPVNYYI